MPTVTPPTIPVADTVATVVGAMLHVPPGRALNSATVLPGHMVARPVMGPGIPFTVIVAVAVPHVAA